MARRALDRTKVRIGITDQQLQPDPLMQWLDQADTGAIASFLGKVRSEQGRVQALTLEHYHRMTGVSLEKIAAQAQGRWDLHGLDIQHRIGTLLPSEPIVFIAVAARYRADALSACEFVADHLKSEAAFWKCEHRIDGNHWLAPSEADRRRLKKWL